MNYKLGRLNGDLQSLTSVLDMGGASVQVAFPVQHPEEIDSRDLVKVNASGQTISLFVHSFLV